MSSYNFHVGEGYVPAYQISGTPYVTSSTISLGEIKEIRFGFATKFFVVRNNTLSGSVLAVGFTQNGLKPANSNYFFLSGSEPFSGELRVDRLFLSGSAGTSTSFTLIAGLTSVESNRFQIVTASNGFNGVG